MRRRKINLGMELDIVPHPSDIIRFMKKIKVVNGCWMWIGGKDKNGYGQFYLRPSRGGVLAKRKNRGRRNPENDGAMIGAHRYAVALFKHRILAGNDVDHCATEECIGHACVHPFKCLDQKTRKDNSIDGRRRQLAASRSRKKLPGYVKGIKKIRDDIPF